MTPVLFFVFITGMVSARTLEPYRVPIGSSVWGYFTPPVLKKPQPLQTPMEAMVDLTNSLGVAILQDHSYSKGNFAFSPYGVASVLVVLYEGARCESANQIHQAVGFPSDKDVLRTGFRDVHRHLRSYFSHEGFLSGITLNKNSSDLKPEYKKILKYYGYDVDLNGNLYDESKVDEDAKPSTQRTQSTKAAEATTQQKYIENAPSATTEAISEEVNLKNETGVEKPEESTEKESAEHGEEPSTTTLASTAKETIPTTEKEILVSTTTSMTTVTESDVKETTEDGGELTTTTAMLPTLKETGDESESEASTTTESTAAHSTIAITSESDTEERTTVDTKKSGEEMKQAPVVLPEDDIQPEVLEPDGNKENKYQKMADARCKKEAGDDGVCEEDENEEAEEAETKAPESDAKKLDNGMLIPQPSDAATKANSVVTDGNFPITTEANKWQKEVPLKEVSGRKFLGEPDETKKNMTRIRKMFDSKYSIWESEQRSKRVKLRVKRYKRTIADYLKWPLNPDLSLQLQNGMYDTHVSRNAEMYKSLPRRRFLVDGAMDTPVPMMTYTNVFPYGYIPRLHAKALEFPLDDIRYKLLIVLPVERRGLRQLIYDLSDFSVREILKCLLPIRVEASIPTFMVEGFVILTSSLQKLGIWDVFDPRKANLSGMSVDPELYVRNIEQSVTVVIRNYVEILDIQTRTMAARYLEHKFEATHPFVYFVLDAATNIALMAGQMLDPLNSRIY